MRANSILGHPLSKRIHTAEDELCKRETLISSAANPLCSFGVVLRHNLAKSVHNTENELREGTAFVSIFTKALELYGR